MSNKQCVYAVGFHKGKVEWHHPISSDTFVGMDLCEAHHSILKGRKSKYAGELMLNKSIDQMRLELKIIEGMLVLESGYKLSDIDKH